MKQKTFTVENFDNAISGKRKLWQSRPSDAGRSSMNTTWKLSTPRAVTNQSAVIAFDRTRVRIQGQYSKSWILVWNHYGRCRGIPMAIHWIASTIVEILKKSPWNEGESSRQDLRHRKKRKVSRATAMQTTTASAVRPVGSGSQAMFTPASPGTNGTSETHVSSAPICWGCSQKSHCQAQCPLVPSYRGQRLATHYKEVENPAIETEDEIWIPAGKLDESRTRRSARATTKRAENSSLTFAICKWTVKTLKADKVKIMNIATNNCLQRTRLKSKCPPFSQATNFGNTSLYPTLDVMNIEENLSDGEAEFAFLSQRTTRLNVPPKTPVWSRSQFCYLSTSMQAQTSIKDQSLGHRGKISFKKGMLRICKQRTRNR